MISDLVLPEDKEWFKGSLTICCIYMHMAWSGAYLQKEHIKFRYINVYCDKFVILSLISLNFPFVFKISLMFVEIYK